MTTQEKCEAILKAMLGEINSLDGLSITLGSDWCGNTGTVIVKKQNGTGMHTHVGVPDGTFETFVDQLHATLCDGCGLSWETDQTTGGAEGGR